MSVFDDRYIKTKARTYGDEFYATIPGLIGIEDDIECKTFTVIYSDSLLIYKSKYYQQVYLDNCAYKIANKQMARSLDDIVFEF